MVELRKDPKVIASAQKRLVAGERVLWAARQPPSRMAILRHLALFTSLLLVFAGIVTLIFAHNFSGYPSVVAFFLIILSPQQMLWVLEIMSFQFVVTDRRVMFVSAFWPFRWSFWNHSELDVDQVRLGRGSSIIHLGPYVRAKPIFGWSHAVYPHHIEGVPDIEAVREAIIAQIASRPAPVDKSSKGLRPSMPGTRTG